MATREEIIFEAIDKVSSVAGGIASSLGNIGAIAGGAAMAGITAATAAVVGGVKAFGDWAGQLDGLGDVLGTNADDSAALAVAIDGVGGNVDAITGQMAKLTKGLENSKGELGPTGKLMSDLGIQFKDANGQMLPATQIIQNVADKISQMPDGLQKSEAMMNLFGKSGKDMTDTLNALTTQGFQAAQAKVKDFGLAIGDDGVNATVEMGKSQKDLELMLKGLGVTIGKEILPAILPLAQQFIAFAREHLPPVIEGVKGFAKFIGDLAVQAKNFVTSSGFIEFAQNAGTALQGAFKGGQEIAERVWPIIQRITKLIGEIFTTIFGDVKTDAKSMQTTVDTVFHAIELVINTVMGAVELALRVTLGVIKGIFKGDWSDIQKIVDDAIKALQTVVDEGMAAVKQFIVDRFNEAIDFVKELPNQFVKFGTAIIEGIAQGIRDGAKAVHDALIQFLKNTLPAWAIQLLGIASPSKVFAEIGTQIPAGLAAGIMGNAGVVYDALQRVTNGSSASMARNAAGVGLAASYDMRDTINVYGNQGVAQQINEARRMATRQAILRAQIG